MWIRDWAKPEPASATWDRSLTTQPLRLSQPNAFDEHPNVVDKSATPSRVHENGPQACCLRPVRFSR
ncbi:hypothetical protein AOZ06_51380 [Kibdelosporangium phytohabitans]|uniref:Uncharacterized protein n=1 Tax=Kibdelosporangium phytohabitans TaxID=860235 RepID=A0A0N9I2J0_9PSEU|nr:hypothetical protein AOZ06_51380 [Kibdelosporangium phytohabitans]